MADGMNANEQSEFFKTLTNLFGVRWDSVIQWIVVGLASAWYWVGYLFPNWDRRGLEFDQGPIDWGIAACRNLGIAVPGWIADIPGWLTAPEHAWLLWLLPIVAAICGTCLAGAQRSSGLVVLSILALLLSVQASMNLRPVIWAALWMLIPVTLALAIAAYQDYRPHSDKHDRGRQYLVTLVVKWYLLAALAPIWEVLLAPLLGFGLLVGMYAAPGRHHDSAEKLAKSRIATLLESKATLSEARASDVVGALAGVMLATADKRARDDLAWSANYLFDEPTTKIVKPLVAWQRSAHEIATDE